MPEYCTAQICKTITSIEHNLDFLSTFDNEHQCTKLALLFAVSLFAWHHSDHTLWYGQTNFAPCGSTFWHLCCLYLMVWRGSSFLSQSLHDKMPVLLHLVFRPFLCASLPLCYATVLLVCSGWAAAWQVGKLTVTITQHNAPCPWLPFYIHRSCQIRPLSHVIHVTACQFVWASKFPTHASCSK